MATDDEVAALADAVAQLLDDMGKNGTCVCDYTKAKVRVALEPFRHEGDPDDFTLADALKIIHDCDGG